MLPQHLHHFVTLRGGDLNHHTQLFVEQGLQAELFTSGSHLLRPVLAVAMVGAAVAEPIAFGDQKINIQVHTHTPCKSHFADRGPQAAVALIVISQQQTLLT